MMLEHLEGLAKGVGRLLPPILLEQGHAFSAAGACLFVVETEHREGCRSTARKDQALPATAGEEPALRFELLHSRHPGFVSQHPEVLIRAPEMGTGVFK